jgi:PAS domain S-box-containing protein
MESRLKYEYALVVLVSVLFACLFWVVDGCFEFKFFHENLSFMLLEGPETLFESLVTKIPLHTLFVRVSFMIACLSGGLLAILFIRKRQRIDTALRESEEKYRLLVETMRDGLWIQDENGLITYANDKFVEMTGYSSGEILGHPVHKFLDESNKRIFEKEMSRTDRGEGKSFVIVWTGKNGRQVPTIMSPQPVLGAGGSFKGSFSVIIDITDQKNTEKKLQIYQEKLRSLASELLFTEERERRRIAAGLHDSVAQDLAMTKFKADALRSTLSSKSISDALAEISALVGQATQQIRSLVFDISPPQLYELGLGAALESLIEKIEHQHGITTEFKDDNPPKPMSEDVCILLFRAVQELFLNIIAHARAGKIGLSIFRNQDQIRIIVEDDGIGFDYNSDDFHRDSTGGFGLFSIRERMNYLGGSFEISSEPGRGTRATLSAPLHHIIPSREAPFLHSG